MSKDVGNKDVEIDFDIPIADNVAASSSVAPLNIMTVMSSELVRIRQRRTKIMKQMKQLKSDFNQLTTREACVKNFMDNYEEPIPSSSSSNANDNT